MTIIGINKKYFLRNLILNSEIIFRNILEIHKNVTRNGWGTKFEMFKFRTTDIPEFQNYEYQNSET